MLSKRFALTELFLSNIIILLDKNDAICLLTKIDQINMDRNLLKLISKREVCGDCARKYEENEL